VLTRARAADWPDGRRQPLGAAGSSTRPPSRHLHPARGGRPHGEWALRIYTAEGLLRGAQARTYAAPAKLHCFSHSMALLTQAPEE
jgi:hypothetical protein